VSKTLKSRSKQMYRVQQRSITPGESTGMMYHLLVILTAIIISIKHCTLLTSSHCLHLR